MQETIASIHIHSVYSDGLKTPPEIARDAAARKIDIIMTCDHNVFPTGFSGYYTFENRNVLLITGEEIHDKKRQPQKNHLLALGIDRDFSPLAANPQILIDSIREAGGLSFIAHAYDPELPMVNEQDLSWVDWSVHGFTGLELWNNLSEFKIRVQKKWQALFFAFFPEFMALEPPKQIRKIWDSLLAKGERVFAIGGADAHTLRYHIGPFTKDVFPYSYHFRAITTHILLDSNLSGDAEKDTRVIIDALRQGHAFIVNDLVKPAQGFRFYLQQDQSIVSMGESVPFHPSQEIVTEIPYPANCRLIRDGKIITKLKINERYSWKIDQPGIYRLECYRHYLGRNRGWIFSNPLFISEG